MVVQAIVERSPDCLLNRQTGGDEFLAIFDCLKIQTQSIRAVVFPLRLLAVKFSDGKNQLVVEGHNETGKGLLIG